MIYDGISCFVILYSGKLFYYYIAQKVQYTVSVFHLEFGISAIIIIYHHHESI